ncbi:MAG: hypothetical protein AB1765_01200 [Candidatus Hydrogenedentota bacterium]
MFLNKHLQNYLIFDKFIITAIGKGTCLRRTPPQQASRGTEAQSMKRVVSRKS